MFVFLIALCNLCHTAEGQVMLMKSMKDKSTWPRIGMINSDYKTPACTIVYQFISKTFFPRKYFSLSTLGAFQLEKMIESMTIIAKIGNETQLLIRNSQIGIISPLKFIIRCRKS